MSEVVSASLHTIKLRFREVIGFSSFPKKIIIIEWQREVPSLHLPAWFLNPCSFPDNIWPLCKNIFVKTVLFHMFIWTCCYILSFIENLPKYCYVEIQSIREDTSHISFYGNIEPLLDQIHVISSSVQIFHKAGVGFFNIPIPGEWSPEFSYLSMIQTLVAEIVQEQS